MGKFKGTQGPWEVEYDNECFFSGSEDGDEYYCEFYTITNKVGNDIGRVESKIDANLIATAPDLLEAVNLILELQLRGFIVIGEKHTATLKSAIDRALGKNDGDK